MALLLGPVASFCMCAQADSSRAQTASELAGGVMNEPGQSPVIALRPPVPGAMPEQWEAMVATLRSVRNVVDPSITPFLPDPAKATGAAVIVAPGGAFFVLSIDSEGYSVARWLAEHGVAAFVLKYRTQATPRDPEASKAVIQKRMSEAVKGTSPIETPTEALEDAMAAVRLVRERAAEWGVDPRRIGFAGFSAGAMTALSVGLVEDATSRPDFIAPIYPPMMAREVPEYAPPMFLAIALDDPLFAVNKDLALIDAWRRAGSPVEVHLYGRGGHGFGMNRVTEASALWTDEFLAWMKDSGIIGNAYLRASGAARFSVARSSMGEMLDDPRARAVLDQHIPQISKSEQLALMRGMTLVQIQGYARELLTPEVLESVQADLDRIPGTP